MAVRTNPWANSRIILKDTYSGETIIDTDIQDSDYTSGWIWINASHFPLAIGEKINALIISPNSLQECCCTVRNISNGVNVQLTVFKRINKEDVRDHQRYTVNLPGIVRNIWVNGQTNVHKTGNVFLVTLLNMSSSGILFKTPKGQFDINDTFDIEARFNNRLLTLSGKVVRIQNTETDGLNEECGATIQTIKYL